MKITPLTCLLAACLAGASCTTGPAHRIAQNPAYFNALATTDQLLVRDGKIRLGLPKDAVVIAMGKPGRISEVVTNNGQVQEIWSYFGSQPVYVYDMWPSYPARGRYGCHRGYAYPDMGPDLAFVPYLQAEITFSNGLVSGWRMAKP